jgi:hypothetical protein
MTSIRSSSPATASNSESDEKDIERIGHSIFVNVFVHIRSW